MSCGGNASPTSSLFPSITSLFQSPIGTPRVTPTPQQYAAAYLFNDDQFHSLIYNSNNTANTNGQSQGSSSATSQAQQEAAFIDAVATVQQTFQLANTVSAADLSPLFNNLISAAAAGLTHSNSTSSSASSSTTTDPKSTNVLLSTNN